MLSFVIGLGLLAQQQATAAAPASVAVQVREAGTTTPIPRARITIIGPGVRETPSADFAGNYHFTWLAAGTYRFTVERESFAFDPTGPGMVTVGPGITEAHDAACFTNTVIVKSAISWYAIDRMTERRTRLRHHSPRLWRIGCCSVGNFCRAPWRGRFSDAVFLSNPANVLRAIKEFLATLSQR